MTARRLIPLMIVLGAAAALLIACGSPAPQQPANPAAVPAVEKNNVEVGADDPQIYLLEPEEDGSIVTSPFNLRVGVANLKIPIQDMTIHIAIDAACAPAGEVINPDAQHISLPRGKMEEPRFNLPVGKHRLCIQVSGRDNVALEGPGLTRVYDIEVVP
jgi:hypothetical protein